MSTQPTISIIICNRTDSLNPQLAENINQTIGCEFEPIIINNGQNKYNIFEAYNYAVEQAHGQILCFMHDDLEFHSEGWGKQVADAFAADENLGLIGITGGQFMPCTPCSYWEGGLHCGQVIQSETKNNVAHKEPRKEGKAVEQPTDVVAVDGLWMCIRADLFRKGLRWDDMNFHKFHCYDLDICFQILETGMKVQVIPGVLIEHKSTGTTDLVYLEQNQLFFEKWKHRLPIMRGCELSDKEIEQRTEMVRMMRMYLRFYLKTAAELKQTQSSKAYLLGKLLLNPRGYFKMKKKIKNNKY